MIAHHSRASDAAGAVRKPEFPAKLAMNQPNYSSYGYFKNSALSECGDEEYSATI